MQPDVVPTPERALDVGVTACKPRAQIAVEVCAPSLGDAGEAVGFDEHVGGERDHGGHRMLRSRCMDQRDRAAVAVPEEHGFSDLELREQRRQDL